MKAVLCVLCMLIGKVLSGEEQPVRGVFKTCAGCRLNAMPGVKAFIYDSVEREEYGDKLRVDFIPGARPELILYGPNNEELSRELAQDMTYDEMHAYMQSMGFERVKELPRQMQDEPRKNKVNHAGRRVHHDYDVGANHDDDDEDEAHEHQEL